MIVAEVAHDAAKRLASAGVEDARLEAEVLLACALSSDRTHLLAELHSRASLEALASFEAMIARRLTHEPLAYIVGRREFYGVEIICAPGALIPRPETEMLVDLALTEVAERGDDLRIADVGTGSGAIAVAICGRATRAHVVAIEPSAVARSMARQNIERHELQRRIELRSGDLLEASGVFDVIVANLPYVSEHEWQALSPEIREHEPREALVGGPIGTEVIERLLAGAQEHLAPRGVLAAEIGAAQGGSVTAKARWCFPDASVCVKKDLAGRDRVLEVRK
ncbi:MAG: peptide chain release factor N(5)-glutamine methyltransferase [Chloroflexota bacterium]|nr:peptide chain release factor N(5)-glutamine methyltransferase [Chloroflexota bacterium]